MNINRRKVAAVYMASGFSTRFQGNKLLVLYHGKPVFTYGLKTLLKARESLFDILTLEIIVVSQYDVINKEAGKLDVPYIYNPHSERGISETIQLGLRYFESDITDYLFLVADQPLLLSDTISGMICEYIKSNKTIACTAFHNKPGNPVIFSSCYKEELLSLKQDSGGKKVMNRHLEEVLYYETQEAELMDLDEIEDYYRLIEISEKTR